MGSCSVGDRVFGQGTENRIKSHFIRNPFEVADMISTPYGWYDVNSFAKKDHSVMSYDAWSATDNHPYRDGDFHVNGRIEDHVM